MIDQNMTSLNSTLEAMNVTHMLVESSLISKVMSGGRYFVAALAVLINTSIAVAFLVQKCRRPKAVKLSPAGLLALNLLFADALIGTISIVHLLTFSSKMVSYPYLCHIRLGVSYLGMTGSQIAVIVVAVDRYVAICYTLKYREWMTLNRSIVMLFCGWAVPMTVAVYVFTAGGWRPGLTRCIDIYPLKFFLRYVWVTSNIAAVICVIAIQCKVFLQLRQHEKETVKRNQTGRPYSQKSARIFYQVTTTFVVCFVPYDVMLIVIMVWFNSFVKTLYDVTSLFAQVSFLVNPLVYSYQTGNIRRPVSDLCADIKRWVCPGRESTARSGSTTATRPPPGIAIIGTAPSTSPDDTHSTSTT